MRRGSSPTPSRENATQGAAPIQRLTRLRGRGKRVDRADDVRPTAMPAGRGPAQGGAKPAAAGATPARADRSSCQIATRQLRRLRADLVIAGRELIDPLHRLPDARIDEQQDALEHGARRPQGLGHHHDRLAQRVAHDAPRQPARDAEREFDLARERLHVVRQRRGFEPPDDLVRPLRDRARRSRAGVFQIHQDVVALRAAGRKEQLAQLRGLRAGAVVCSDLGWAD